MRTNTSLEDVGIIFTVCFSFVFMWRNTDQKQHFADTDESLDEFRDSLKQTQTLRAIRLRDNTGSDSVKLLNFLLRLCPKGKGTSKHSGYAELCEHWNRVRVCTHLLWK